MMKKSNLFFILAAFIFCSACNDEWKEEQYEHFVSFKAPINDKGVTRIYVRYKTEGAASYKLPLIVSGSTLNDKSITAHVAVDSDTLETLNYERFQDRTDLYYRELGSQFFTMPANVTIPAGEITTELGIDFTLDEIDLADKWVLPLTLMEDASYDYMANPRKNYRKALLRIMPFNDYSGNYSGTGLKIFLRGYENEAPIVRSQIPTYVVDENTIFFYAGMIGEDDFYRKNYKIFAHFDEESKIITYSAEDLNINFEAHGTSIFKIDELMDDVRPYLLHRYITINNIDYTFTDYTTVPGETISFTVRGSLIMERKINTQVPDEDQAIEW
ncbi:MAG: DUF4973 domain-containing protein [Proteiniphilum sp.]|jgi:hypothetical protein|nr:DUF4973 domain-containing protein [Proteiniphilum sp.]